MKTIDELVAEVAKNAGTANPDAGAPKKASVAARAAETKTHKCGGDCKGEGSCKCNKSSKPRKISDKMTLAMAKEIVRAVEIASDILGIKTVTAICNEGANLVLLHAMDDSYIASIQAAQDKAYTAVALKMPTHEALSQSRGGALDGLTNGNGIMLLGGGSPLRIADKIYGGVGVSGGTKEQDTLLSTVAAEIFRARFA